MNQKRIVEIQVEYDARLLKLAEYVDLWIESKDEIWQGSIQFELSQLAILRERKQDLLKLK